MGARTHYFMGACALIILGARRALIFKRAQALIVQRQTSKEQLQSGHERISSLNVPLKKWVRAHPLFLGARRALIILGGLDEHRFLRGREHSSFREHSIRELMNEHLNMKGISKNKLMKYSLEKWGRAPIILGACALIILRARRAPIILGARRALIFKGALLHLIMWHFLDYSFVHK